MTKETGSQGSAPATDEIPAGGGDGSARAFQEQLMRRLDAIELRISALAHEPHETAAQETVELFVKSQGVLQQSVDTLYNHVMQELHAVAEWAQQLEQQIDRLAAKDEPDPPEGVVEQVELVADAGSGLWHRVIFGADLSSNAALVDERAALIDGMLAGDPAACSLAGQLLVFQSAPDSQKPQLLKDLGEAFYRWRPKPPHDTNPLETALAAWLEKACEAAGIRRKIDVVEPGARFNAAYHRAADRGVELTDVFGWVILREDGSVYQKASVNVK